MKRNDLIVHPVRSRIVGALAGRGLTTAQLARLLPDVPTPSLYRHVRVLAEAEIIVPAESRQVRGATERTYTLAEGGGQIDPEAATTPEARLTLLQNFTNLVVQGYRTYAEAGGEEMAVAGMTALYLSEEEHAALREALRQALAPHLNHAPGDGRKRRLLSLIDQPDFEPAPESA
ncbi:MAG: helix-turn-helix domain-containing protein [Fimbriimonas sp.]